MPPITALVEIKRSPQDVFLYVADPTQRPNWQDALEHIEVLSVASVDDDGVTVGDDGLG